MGALDRLLGRDLAGQPPGRPARRALTAAGARVDLTAPQPVMMRRHEWQAAAWGYRDSVPEMRFAMDFVADALGRVRLFPAENRPRGEDPVPFGAEGVTVSARSQQIAREAIDRIDLDKHGSSLIKRAGENLDIAGECYLLGEQTDTGESWSIRSVSEVRLAGEGVQLVEPGKTTGGRLLEPTTSDLLRLWNPHPQFYDWPDSGMAASLEYAEELRLLSRLIRSTTRSRLASGALLYVPNEMSLTRAGGAGQVPATPPMPLPGQDVDEDDDPFHEELVAAFVTPISDESDPSAVAPLLIRGPAMIGDKPALGLIGTVEIPRQDPAKLAEQREAATRAFARGIKLPPEILMGLGQSNHWSGWVIDSTTAKNYIEPRVEVLCDAFTVAYLRSYMQAAGCPPEDVARTVLWFDAAELVQNPNRGADAKSAHEAGAISDEVLARALGFGVEDMPTVHERLFRAIERRAISDQQLPVMLAAAGLPADHELVVAAVAAARAGVAQRAARIGGRPVVDAEPSPSADDPVPADPLPRTAAATPDPGDEPVWRVDEHLCRQLADIDAQLVTRLLAHAEATVGRAVERAATRIKARSQRDPELAAAFRGADQVAVVASLGRARVAAFAAEDDVDDSIGVLRALWNQAVGEAAERVAELVGRMLGRPPSRELVDRLVAGGDRAWSWLARRLAAVAQRLLFGEPEPVERGEGAPGVVPPSLIRGALAQAGGMPVDAPGVDDDGVPAGPRRPGPVGGLGSGDAVGQHMHANGAVDLGYEWSYFGIGRRSFAPHLALSGRRFPEWNDELLATRPEHLGWIGPYYAPGDHKGCMCSVTIIWASPARPDEARALADAAVLEESEGARQRRELLAEADDAAGRTGTDAQRKRDLRNELVRLRRRHIDDRDVA